MKYHASFLLAAAFAPSNVEALSISSFKSQVDRGYIHRSRLFGLPNSDTDVKSDLKRHASNEGKVLRPHAPTIPHPTKDDESVLQYANKLLDAQATKSPTRRIADDEFYTAQPSPTKHYLQSLNNDLSVGPRPTPTSIELLRVSKRRAQKLLSRSIFEKERAEEKKARIKSRMEEELRDVEEGLKMKLDMAMMGIEDDVEKMQILINRELILEEERMAQFNILVQNLQSSSLAIQKDMASETKIYHEMKALRSKLDRGSTSKHLDKLIARKEDLLGIESDLLNDLKQCALETKQAFLECERRYKSMQTVLDTVCRPVRSLSRNYDWSDLDIMETVLTEATKDVEQSEARLMGLRERIEYALMQKDAILSESVTVQPKANEKQNEIARNNSSSSILKFSDLQDKNDADVIKQIAISLGNATYSGSKATALALKTILEAVSTKEVSMAADRARVKTNQVNFGSNETFKESARAALDSIVDTTKVFFEKAVVSEASREAGASVQNVTNELMSAANALSVLGTRAYKKLLNQLD